MKSLYSLLILAFFLTSCEEEKTIYVANQLADCEGSAPQKCMMFKENKADEWSYFYDSVEGFTYEEGYDYVIKVKISKIKNPPADASEFHYKLIEIVSKEKAILSEKEMQNSKSILGEWEVVRINNFENTTSKSPYFTIKKGQINGFSGCNTFGGSLNIDNTKIFKSGMLRMTKMFCAETAKLETAFTTALSKTTNYTYENDKLVLFDDQQNELLVAVLKEAKIKKAKRETLSIRYSATSRGFSNTINFVGNQLIYEVVRPTPEKTAKQISEANLDIIYNLVSKLNLEKLEGLEPPSKAHQYDGAPGGTFIIISKDVTYRTPTFDYGNPPAEIKELVDKLLEIKELK